MSKTFQVQNQTSQEENSFIPIPEIVWYVLLTEFQSLVKNSNFPKFLWSENFWKSENSSLKFKFYQISTAIQTKIKTTFGRFRCHLICLNLKSRLEGLWYGEYENDGVKNGTKVRTYETLVNFGQFQTGIKPQIEFHYAEFWNI